MIEDETIVQGLKSDDKVAIDLAVRQLAVNFGMKPYTLFRQFRALTLR